MVERLDRRLIRLGGLQGETFELPVTLLRTGEAVWLAVEGEPYSRLQVELRRRFPERAIIVMALANGSRSSYLPPRELYGSGIYQESIAVLEAGSLETLIDEIGRRMESLWAS
jgi:hypothetical protein